MMSSAVLYAAIGAVGGGFAACAVGAVVDCDEDYIAMSGVLGAVGGIVGCTSLYYSEQKPDQSYATSEPARRFEKP